MENSNSEWPGLQGARQSLRGHIGEGELAIIRRGDLVATLLFAARKKNATVHPDSGVLNAFISQASLVAGAGLVLSLRQPQVESKAGLIGCFNELFSARA